jgi:betaine-aldehyde dehydrogenase
VQRATKEDVERAVVSAEKGQKIWAAMTAMERSRILRRAVDILRERNDELAALKPWTPAKPSPKPSTSTSSPVPTCWNTTQAWCRPSKASRSAARHVFVYTRREPLGAGIGAWNYPIQIAVEIRTRPGRR